MAVISINYAEDSKRKDLGYKSVQILYGSTLKKKKIFRRGDFVKDWYYCCKFWALQLSQKGEEFMESSSVEHFFSDGASKLYDPAMLHIKDGVGRLEYGKLSKGKILYYVKKRTKPQWLKFRELCGDPSKKKAG